MDNDVFRWEAAEVLRRAVGFDTWCWVLLDPATGMPTRYASTNPVIDRDQRRFFPLELQSRAACISSGRTWPAEVNVLSAATGGALDRDPLWREMLGPAGLGDQLGAPLAADGVDWAYLTLYRDDGRASVWPRRRRLHRQRGAAAGGPAAIRAAPHHAGQHRSSRAGHHHRRP